MVAFVLSETIMADINKDKNKNTLIYNNTYTATVVASAPELGVALVQRAQGAAKISDIVLAYYPVMESPTGASAMPMYAVGCTVLCTRCYLNSMEVVFITGLCNKHMDARDNSYGHRKLYNAEAFTQSCAEALSGMRLLERMKPASGSAWIRNHANGFPADALPGDYEILDKITTLGLHVGRDVVQLRGSSLAMIDLTDFGSRVRLVGQAVETHTMLTEQVAADQFTVTNQAANIQESFGVLYTDGNVVDYDLDAETLTPRDEFAIPLYRLQNVSGALAQGFEEMVVGWPVVGGSPASRHDDTQEPPLLARRRLDYSGEASQASAHSIASVKTPWIQGITQLGYGGNATDPPYMFDDLREPYYKEQEPNEEPDIPEEEDEDAITDAAINKMVDKLLTGAYKEAMLKALQEHGFSVTSSQSSITGEEADVELPGGATQQQHYDLPEHIDITDPFTGRKQRYYSSMSFITQERDGSICICDGYGSEIRMCRGNIYISPALDLIMRPGRDLSSMVPGHLSLNAQGTITINSSDSMYVRAIKDLKIVGATDGTGVVTVESRATSGPDNTGLPGLVIRSDSNLSLTSVNDLYIGRNTNSGDGQGNVTVPDTSGSIIMDAGGNGGMYARCRSITVDANELTAGAFSAAENSVIMSEDGEETSTISGSAITMNTGSIGIFSGSVVMPATLNMKAVEDVVKAPLCRDGSAKTAQLNTATEPSLWLQGSMVIGQDLIVNGNGKFNGHGKRGHALQAYGIVETKDNVKLKPGSGSTKRRFREQELPPTPASAAPAASAASSAAENAATRSYQDWFITGNQFAFPLTYNVDLTIMPGMVWQERSKLSDNPGEFWHETYMKDAEGNETACYPGYDIWETAKVSERGGKKDTPLNEGYVTNAKHED